MWFPQSAVSQYGWHEVFSTDDLSLETVYGELQQDPVYDDFRGTSLKVITIYCIPCEPSDAAKAEYSMGRSVIPSNVKWIQSQVLKDCPTVTSVSLSDTTRFNVKVHLNALASPVLTRLQITPLETPGTHHSYVPRCLMNHPELKQAKTTVIMMGQRTN